MDADDGLSRPSHIFHLATDLEWQGALTGHSITPESLVSEGFVHCSTAAQLDGVMARFYAGRDDVWILTIDPDLLDAELRWEAPAHPDGSPNTDAEAADRFPHVYGPIPVSAVVSARRP